MVSSVRNPNHPTGLALKFQKVQEDSVLEGVVKELLQ
jgi:hypothetical protein